MSLGLYKLGAGLFFISLFSSINRLLRKGDQQLALVPLNIMTIGLRYIREDILSFCIDANCFISARSRCVLSISTVEFGLECELDGLATDCFIQIGVVIRRWYLAVHRELAVTRVEIAAERIARRLLLELRRLQGIHARSKFVCVGRRSHYYGSENAYIDLDSVVL